MNAPFFKFGLFNTDVSLIIAFIIGIGFGFALERGGFGSARILAAQFYFSNMRVLKVMFTAIITAMLGLYYLSVIGFVDLSLIYISETYILPQVIGGLILGIGFVIGGYCPGTSVVSFATGKLDGLMYILGVMFGIFLFGEIFPFITDFYYSTNMGSVTLPKFLHLSYGMVVFLVVIMAVGAFALAEWSEKKFAHRNPENQL
ncbi:Rhodanese domain protein [Ignavibacterium album JCM 16511]|uniref:Rhodanese domain protein n=1 Tax=Ignavibacterium album (strain DSM 19864 / JCM 16511 / NBRC 101810 / Mat9-16) TaxID=945713 RepID=I0AK60_IGNAJ|nr:YeeE/YedE thiosulfate transporter family protein [Ignavibacterium album]AFH49367.1 Rhodanese domain protein [Ignavibacterium album JCM 16511]